MADSLPENSDTPEPMRRLGDALWGQNQNDISHDECRALLPEYLQAEVAGEDAAGRFPEVKRHLDHCEDCGEEYAMLVDLELAEEAGELELAREPAAPAFTYEQARTPELKRIVVEWTRALVAILSPANAKEIDRAADQFFGTLKPRQANETRAAYGAALVSGAGDTDPSLTLLAAAFMTIQELIDQVSGEQFDAWAADNRLNAELELRAAACAEATGMDPAAAHAFVRAFAQVSAGEPTKLRSLLGS